VDIRRAGPADGPVLTRIAHSAKRHWHYPEEWIRLWRDALTVTGEFIERHPVYCAERGGEILGFYALVGEGNARQLEHLWVAPEHIGAGIGARLLAHAWALCRADDAKALSIVSDPNAEGFYLKQGARRVGEVASSPAGRALPLLLLEPD
jgi:GNAT superfamily N-acetyltransferase